ncbi:hypothetical protein SAMN05444146_1573 [Flavobacterium johnsoniae]|jgi:hypothetical protein|uniref:Uncharacterized protein n=1 Tax=Flavobacterium johnsoniae TaxID=986 RepID=A0A1M6TPN4_FLAJO|nr:hypothetical protein SAMN05444388_110130 [Flavobacterium johnsoniae]SHK58768.1 hypothetical protein SAMN05444146_1573 [Flavobacterium johnsoniae]
MKKYVLIILSKNPIFDIYDTYQYDREENTSRQKYKTFP